MSVDLKCLECGIFESDVRTIDIELSTDMKDCDDRFPGNVKYDESNSMRVDHES